MKSSAQLMADARVRAVEKSVTVKGVETHYWFYPALQADPSSAKDAVLIHGYRGDHHGLEAFAGGLREFNVYAPDLPGFGKSGKLNQTHNLDAYSTWLKDFLEAVRLTKPIAIGHSFGTLIISDCESTHNLFEKLILVNPVCGGRVKGVSKLLLRFVKLYYWIAHLLPEGLGIRMAKSYLLVDSMSAFATKSKDKELRRWIKQEHRTHFNSFSNSQVIWESYLTSTGNLVTPYVRKISKPVLMIAADLDEITPVYKVKEITQTMTNAEVYEIKGCGHLVHYEAAQEAVDVMNRFLAKQH